AADDERGLGELDCLHRRAALQLLRRRDEGSAPHPRRASRAHLRRRDRRAAAPSGRLSARLRAALGRRPRLPGDDRQGRRRQPDLGLRHLRARIARAGAGDRQVALPPRGERGARYLSGRARARLAGRPRRRRDLHGVPAPPVRRRARRAGGPRAGQETSARGGRGMSTFELLDELEAGGLAIQYEGEEPQALLEWALEEFAPNIAISAAFQADDVALIDMAYRLDPSVRVFTVDTGRLPEETHELIAALHAKYPGLNLDVLEPDAGQVQRLVAKKGLDLMKESV